MGRGRGIGGEKPDFKNNYKLCLPIKMGALFTIEIPAGGAAIRVTALKALVDKLPPSKICSWLIQTPYAVNYDDYDDKAVIDNLGFDDPEKMIFEQFHLKDLSKKCKLVLDERQYRELQEIVDKHDHELLSQLHSIARVYPAAPPRSRSKNVGIGLGTGTHC